MSTRDSDAERGSFADQRLDHALSSERRNLICRFFGHRWQVVYTDDDECARCKTVRLWPMVPEQAHLWPAHNDGAGGGT